MVHVTSAVLVAALVAAPILAAPVVSDESQFYGRDLEEFEARSTTGGRAAKEVAKNVVEGVGQSKMKDTIKKYTNPPVQVPQGLKDAAKKSTSGFSQAAVDHATGHGKKKRSLDFEELYVRSTTGGRAAKEVAKNVVEGVGQSKLKDTIKKYTNPPVQVPQGLKDAAKKSTSGFSQAAVDHATGHGKKKRSFDFDEFYARSTTGGRAAKEVAKNVVEGVGQSKMKDTIKKYTNPPAHVPEGLKEAAKKSTSGFSQAAVDHATGHGKKKRSLDFDEFYARSTTGGRAAKEVAKNVVEGVGQSKMKDTIKKYTNPPAHVPEGLKEAAKKSTSGFSQAAVDHATGHGKKKRSLEFNEFYARSTTGGRAAKEVAKNVVEGVGQSKLKDTIKKYTNPPVEVPQGLKDAAKKSTSGFSQGAMDQFAKSHGKKKRDFEDMEMYERDFEDFEDMFERDFFDDLEERDLFDELEEREFYELNELD
jgi:hypothetical protein